MTEKFITSECYTPLENISWYVKEVAERMDRAGYKVVQWTLTAVPPDHTQYIQGGQIHFFCMLGELKDGHSNNDTAKP